MNEQIVWLSLFGLHMCQQLIRIGPSVTHSARGTS